MLRNQNERARIHPRLEKLEDRSQPGSLLAEIAGWSLLGETLGMLQLDEPAETASPVAAASPTERLPFASGSERETDPAGPGRPVLSTSRLLPRHFDREELLTAASLSLKTEDEGGATITKADGTWYSLAPMPSRRQEIATAALNGEIYVIGGYDMNGQPTDTVEVYDPKTDTWRSAAPLPIVNEHGQAAVAAGVLYAFGGRSNRVFAYDPKGDAWYEVAPMNYQHGGTAAVAVIDDIIYVAGGSGPGMAGNEFEVYDPYLNKWTALAPMNIPRNHTGGGNIDGYFYVAAGRGHPQAGRALEVYLPETDKWALLPEMPTARSGVGVGVVNSCLYVFGGETPGVFSEVEFYDPSTGEWGSATPMLTPRHGLFASVIGNAIYLPGGATREGFGATDTNEVFVIE